MEIFGQIFQAIYEILKIEMEVFQFRFTLLNLLVYSVVAYGLLRFFFEIFFPELTSITYMASVFSMTR